MADVLPGWLARYRRHERSADVAFWVAVLCLQVAFNSITTWMDLRRSAAAYPYWHPLLWELTSTAVVGALIPAIAWWERRHPVRLDTLPACLGWHLAGSVAFSLLHVAGMVALREAAYAALGRDYRMAPWTAVLAYEYLKDVRSYAAILAAIVGWRFLLLRTQGEARVLDAPEPPPDGPGAAPTASGPPEPAAPPARPERFLVRKLRKEFLVAAADIEWLQAQGNYLGLRVHGHDYLLRSTLADFLAQLDPARFARVHRSWAVNLDRIAEIEPLDAGDARLKMKDGSTVPCSRRYRDALGR